MPRNVIYQTLDVSNIQNFEQKILLKQKNKLSSLREPAEYRDCV